MNKTEKKDKVSNLIESLKINQYYIDDGAIYNLENKYEEGGSLSRYVGAITIMGGYDFMLETFVKELNGLQNEIDKLESQGVK